MKAYYTLFLLLTGCGITVHTDDVHVAPIHVTFDINMEAAQQYCKNKCGGDPVCSTACFNEFLAVLSAASGAYPTPTPHP